jgi:hypothetical protein
MKRPKHDRHNRERPHQAVDKQYLAELHQVNSYASHTCRSRR